ncbi:MAG: hypothetical protein WC795_02835 [Candidatus Paceibacterota bacterium]|jgi:hypothetical protein
MKKTSLFIGLVVSIIAILAAVYFFVPAPAPSKYDAFATCLKDKGANFYGAFWCPHCQQQKELFGRSKNLLPYIECSTPDTKGQTLICQEKKIESYPTWIFADDSRLTGEIPLQELAEKTSCVLPE